MRLIRQVLRANVGRKTIAYNNSLLKTTVTGVSKLFSLEAPRITNKDCFNDVYDVILFQSPPKGATIPYRPKPQVGGPVILAGGQAYTIQGNYAVPAHSDVSIATPVSYLGHAHPLAPPPLGHALSAAAALPPLFAFDPLRAAGQMQPGLSPAMHSQLTDVSRHAPSNGARLL